MSTWPQVTGAGVAQMTYGTNGSDQQSLEAPALTEVWSDDGQLEGGYLQVNYPTVNLCFGIDPFSGTGSYTELPYFMFTESWVLSDSCHGFYTTGDDLPDLDVTTFTIEGEFTVWAMSLTANLVWYVEDCQQPPLSLSVSSLTMTTREVPSDDATTARGDFDDVVRQRVTALARSMGVSSFPA